MGAQEGGLACPPTCPIGDLDLDARGSSGTFQIYRAVHGGDCAYWENPVNAMRLMDARWKWGYARAGGGAAFLAAPHAFLNESVPNAQGSIGWTREIASGAFRVALIAYIDLLQSRAVSVPPDLAGLLEATAGGLDDRGSELNQFRDQVDQLRLALVVMAEQLRKQALGR